MRIPVAWNRGIDTTRTSFYIFRMHTFETGLIRPLGLSENQFLQVLLDKWELEANGEGVSLRVRFGEGTPAINTRQAKYLILKAMDTYYGEKRGEYQTRIDSFFQNPGSEAFSYNDECFPFRYVSGGTLPIVSIGGRSYYCFFYHDIFPIGWNIANGGCDTRGELNNPFRTIERELCEELLVINPVYKARYIFERNKNKLIDGLEYEVADNVWEKQLLRLDIGNFTELMLPIKWIEGPDSVIARFEDSAELVTRGYFLNINAEDFGIEVDKISHISLDPFDILMSGEIIQGHLVNEPIGLFDVDRFEGEPPDPEDELIPDKFFFNATAYDGSCFKEIAETEFFPYVGKYRTNEEHSFWEKTENKYNLCPVTRQILKRYLTFKKNGNVAPEKKCDIFLCFGEEDRGLAVQINEFFTKKKKRVFLRPIGTTHEDWRSIDQALDTASCLVAIGSSRRSLTHHFPSYEYRSFHRDMMFAKNGKKARLFSLVTGIRQQDLPPPLCHHTTVVCGAQGIQAAMRELASLI